MHQTILDVMTPLPCKGEGGRGCWYSKCQAFSLSYRSVHAFAFCVAANANTWLSFKATRFHTLVKRDFSKGESRSTRDRHWHISLATLWSSSSPHNEKEAKETYTPLATEVAHLKALRIYHKKLQHSAIEQLVSQQLRQGALKDWIDSIPGIWNTKMEKGSVAMVQLMKPYA